MADVLVGAWVHSRSGVCSGMGHIMVGTCYLLVIGTWNMKDKCVQDTVLLFCEDATAAVPGFAAAAGIVIRLHQSPVSVLAGARDSD
jgi:hypothetical protein